MRLDSRPPVGVLPVALIAGAGNPLGEHAMRLVVRMREKLMAVQNHFGLCNCGNERADRTAIASKRRPGSAHNFVNIKSVSVRKSLFQKFPRDFESDKTKICRRRKRRITEFVNIKRKFSPNVTVGTLAIGHAGSILPVQIWKRHPRRRINRFRVPDRVAQVVRQSPNRKGVLFDGARIPKETRNKVASAHVMRQVAEKLLAEWIVTHVLDR